MESNHKTEKNNKIVFHNYKELKKYCDDVSNPLDKVVLGKEITSLQKLFFNSSRTNDQFKGIENWDVSNVEDMNSMFCYAKFFNQPLNNWNVSNVKDMCCMFARAKSFNQPLDKWNVSNVKDMSYMFSEAKSFNQPLNNWNVSNVEYMPGMFEHIDFNQPLDNWNVSNVRDMNEMFNYSKLERNNTLPNWYKE